MGRVILKKPEWIKFNIPGGKEYVTVKTVINKHKLNTVCLEANCPNLGECLGNKTVTFLILGKICTRNCLYCSIEKGIPSDVYENEPVRVALAIRELDLKYSVITSVTRDDLIDGGASIFIRTIGEIRKHSPKTKIELLIPDFNKDIINLKKVIEEKPDIINHNIEVVKNYYKILRPKGDYSYSLKILKIISDSGIITKSGLMIGFGENISDIKSTLIDLFRAGVDIVTIGQYLQSSKKGFKVKKYYTPDEFSEIKSIAKNIGLKKVFSAPNVRSSYHAEILIEK